MRIGVLFSETGVTSVIERCQRKATLLAIEEINEAGGLGGHALEPTILDPASDPETYRRMAEDLVGRRGISVIFGCYMSSTRKAVLPCVERHRALLFYPTLYEGFEYSTHVIYTGAAPNQNSVQLCHYLLEEYGNRFAFIGSDYIYPRESNRIMRDLLNQAGGEVVLERYLPLSAGEADFADPMAAIAEARPDVIFSTVVGQSTAGLYRAYRRTGLDPARCPIASLTTTEAEVEAMGNEAAEGHITSAPYFASLETPRNRRFLEAYASRFGDTASVNHCAEAAYFQVHLFAKAALEAGSIAFEPLSLALRGQGFEAPQGPVQIDPENNHTYLWPRIGQVGPDGRFEILAESKAAVRPDPYLIAHRLDDRMVALRQKKRVV